MPTGQGDIANPNAWSGSTPTLDTGSPAPQPGPQGDFPQLFSWQPQTSSLEPQDDPGTTGAQGDLTTPLTWAPSTDTLSVGSTAIPPAHGDIGDVTYDGDAPLAGLAAWASQTPTLGLGSVGPVAAQGDLTSILTWVGEASSLGVGALPTLTGDGDVTDPYAWVSAPILSGTVYGFVPEIALAWNLLYQAGSDIIAIEVYRSDDGAAFALLATLAPTATAYDDTTIVRGHTYEYYIEEVWSSGYEIQSNTLTFLPSFTNLYTADGTWNFEDSVVAIQVTVLGGGAGGSSGDYNNDSVGADYFPEGAFGGNGGAYAQVTYNFTSSSTSPVGTTESVTVGAAGAGAPSQTITGSYVGDGANGSSGGGSAFGSLVTAAGGAAPVARTQSSAATASVSGGTSVTTENGGIGGTLALDTDWLALRPGTNTTYAGAGGSGGMASDNYDQEPGFFEPGTVQPGATSATGAAGAGGTGAFIDTSGATATAGLAGDGGAATGVAGGGSGGGGGLAGFYLAGGNTSGWTLIASAGGNGGGYAAGGGGGGVIVGIQKQAPLGVGITGAGGNGAPGVVQVINYYW